MKKLLTLIGLACVVLIRFSSAQTPDLQCNKVNLSIEKKKRSAVVSGVVEADLNFNESVSIRNAVAVIHLRYKDSPFVQYQEAQLVQNGDMWEGDFVSFRKQKNLTSVQIQIYGIDEFGDGVKCVMIDENNQPADYTVLAANQL